MEPVPESQRRHRTGRAAELEWLSRSGSYRRPDTGILSLRCRVLSYGPGVGNCSLVRASILIRIRLLLSSS